MVSHSKHRQDQPRPVQEELRLLQQHPHQLHRQSPTADNIDEDEANFTQTDDLTQFETFLLPSDLEGDYLAFTNDDLVEFLDPDFAEELVEAGISVVDTSNSTCSGDVSNILTEGKGRTPTASGGKAGASRYETISPEPFEPPVVSQPLSALVFRSSLHVLSAADVEGELDVLLPTSVPASPEGLINRIEWWTNVMEEVENDLLGFPATLTPEPTASRLPPSPGGSVSSLFKERLFRQDQEEGTVLRSPAQPTTVNRKLCPRDPRLRSQRSLNLNKLPVGELRQCSWKPQPLRSERPQPEDVTQRQQCPTRAPTRRSTEASRGIEHPEVTLHFPGFSVEEPRTDMPDYATCTLGRSVSSRDEHRQRNRRGSRRRSRFARLQARSLSQCGVGTPTLSLQDQRHQILGTQLPNRESTFHALPISREGRYQRLRRL
jgi:hypothetical protein